MNWQIRKMSVSSILLSISCDDMTDDIGAQAITQPNSSTMWHVCPIDTKKKQTNKQKQKQTNKQIQKQTNKQKQNKRNKCALNSKA